MVEFPDREAVANWLERIDPTERRNDVAVTLAARASLRVLPLIVSSLGHPLYTRGEATGLVLQVFRALAVSWVAARYSVKGESFRSTANSATALLDNNEDIAKETGAATLNTFALNTTPLGGSFRSYSTVDIVSRRTAYAAAEAVKTASANAVTFPREFPVQFAVDAVHNSIVAAANAVARETMGSGAGAVGVDDDANAIDSGMTATHLAGSPLWLEGRPNLAEPAWRRLKEALLAANEGWEVWIDWYERRLRGGTRDEAYELVFADGPPDVWRRGPAAANAWIREHLPTPQVDEGRIEAAINDNESLETWLRGQSCEVAVVIAVRAALRVAPLAVRLLRNQQSDQGFELVATLASAIYRACASARVVARYPVHTIELRTAAHVAASHAAGASASGAAAFVSAGTSAAYAAYAAFYTNAEASAANAANSVAQAVAAASNADAYDPKAAIRAIWEETRVDVALVQDLGVIASSDLPLWSHGAPLWAGLAWSSLQEALPERENWKVWTDWYEDRLNGGSRGEAYELVFASVPIDVWEKGRAAANAWILEHLPSDGREDLKQQAALFTFGLTNGRIVVEPERAKPEDEDATRDFLEESRRKAAELRERLARVQADTRLRSTIALLGERLSPTIEKIRIGLVISSLRSLESDFRVYDSEEGRKEHAGDLVAALGDLAETVRDFVSQFPRSREIIANQIALEIVEEPRALDAAISASDDLARAAESSPLLIEPAVAPALREPRRSVEDSRTIADRAKQIALRLLTVANFGRVVAQARELAIDSLGEAQKQVPKAAGNVAAGAVLGGATYAFGLWLGEDGRRLLMEMAGPIAAINISIGKPGGAFDRLLKTIEKIGAQKAPDDSLKPTMPRRRARKTAKRRKSKK